VNGALEDVGVTSLSGKEQQKAYRREENPDGVSSDVKGGANYNANGTACSAKIEGWGKGENLKPISDLSPRTRTSRGVQNWTFKTVSGP